jgi:hypothetical protein
MKLMGVQPIVKMTLNLVKRIKGQGIANGYFDVVAAVAVVLKLLFGLNDVNWDQNGAKSMGKGFLEKVKKEADLEDEEMQTLITNLEVVCCIPS